MAGAAQHNITDQETSTCKKRISATKHYQKYLIARLEKRAELLTENHVTIREQLSGQANSDNTVAAASHHLDAGFDDEDFDIGEESDPDEDAGWSCPPPDPSQQSGNTPSNADAEQAPRALHLAHKAAQQMLAAKCETIMLPELGVPQPPLPAEPEAHQITMDHYPNYPWEQTGESSVKLRMCKLKLPAKLDQPAHKTVEGFDTHWTYSPDWLEPLFNYYTTMEWTVGPAAQLGITWLELYIDFTCHTFIYPTPANCSTCREPFKLQEYFAAASRRVLALCGKRFDNFVTTVVRVPSLATLDLPDCPGFVPRPQLKCPKYVAANMLNLVRNNPRLTSTNGYKPMELQLPTRP